MGNNLFLSVFLNRDNTLDLFLFVVCARIRFSELEENHEFMSSLFYKSGNKSKGDTPKNISNSIDRSTPGSIRPDSK